MEQQEKSNLHSIARFLSFDQLKSIHLIPECFESQFENNCEILVKTVLLPRFIGSKNEQSTEHFYLFIYEIVKKMMQNKFNTDITRKSYRVIKLIESKKVVKTVEDLLYHYSSKTKWKKSLDCCWNFTREMLGYKNKLTLDDFDSYIPKFFEPLNDWVRTTLQSDVTLQFDKELDSDLLNGMIEIQSEDFIGKIVVISKVQEIKKQKLLRKFKSNYIELLIKFCIQKEKHPNLNKILIFLPLQKLVLKQNLKKWDHFPLLEFIKKRTLEENQKISMRDSIVLLAAFDFNLVGMHISKQFNGDITASITSWCDKSNAPFQIFLRSPKVKSGNFITDREIKDINSIIVKSKVKMYVHSLYLINLCQTEDECFDSLKSDLKNCSKMSGRGVVVHVGKSKTLSTKKAMSNMFENIKKFLKYSTELCPLLLETPAGLGTETLTLLSDFADFYNKFSEDEKKRFKICVDSCHVFASGIDPYTYLTILADKVGIQAIELIHFNDSQLCFDAHDDEHFAVGGGITHLHRLAKSINFMTDKELNKNILEGKIGTRTMAQIALFAQHYNISMVRE